MQLLVNVDVSDLEKAEEFYCRALELTAGRRFGSGGVELLGASSAIYLLKKPAGSAAAAGSSQLRDYSRHWTPVHMDFVVPDLDVALSRCFDAGARLEGEARTEKWGRIAVLADPFGHGFCLIQFLNRGYDEIASPR